MPDVNDCLAILAGLVAEEPTVVRARVDRDWMGKGGSQPRRWKVVDDHEYAVKHPNNPQVTGGAAHLLATEYVVARVGLAMGAPVFPCAVIDVAPELVHGVTFTTGVAVEGGRCFGSLIQLRDSGVDADAAPADWRTSAANRPRAASICVLRALFEPGDAPQFVVRKSAPYEFWSIDHGLFISGNGVWPGDLAARTDLAEIAMEPFSDLDFTLDELRAAALPLVQLGDGQIARCIAPMPAEWQQSAELRASCLSYLSTRRDKIRDLVGLDSGGTSA